jgi:hypothetical protein
MHLIDDCMNDALSDLDNRFQKESAQWPLVKRNAAITARNRFMAEHGEWLGLDLSPMPLEKPEAA